MLTEDGRVPRPIEPAAPVIPVFRSIRCRLWWSGSEFDPIDSEWITGGGMQAAEFNRLTITTLENRIQRMVQSRDHRTPGTGDLPPVVVPGKERRIAHAASQSGQNFSEPAMRAGPWIDSEVIGGRIDPESRIFFFYGIDCLHEFPPGAGIRGFRGHDSAHGMDVRGNPSSEGEYGTTVGGEFFKIRNDRLIDGRIQQFSGPRYTSTSAQKVLLSREATPSRTNRPLVFNTSVRKL